MALSFANSNAVTHQSTNSNILRQLVNRIEELSQAISPPDSDSNNDTINGEVCRIFTGATNEVSRAAAVTGPAPVAATRGRGQVPRARQPYPTSSREERLPIRHNNFAVRCHFANQRPSATSSRRRGNRATAVDNRPFLRNLVLLSGPEDTIVPRQRARLLLIEHGHGITACRFTKNLTPAQVEINIIEAFDGKIPAGVEIELLMSVHTSLVAPTLAPGQCGIDGVILHRLFKQKPVYVRPSCQLLDARVESQVRNN